MSKRKHSFSAAPRKSSAVLLMAAAISLLAGCNNNNSNPTPQSASIDGVVASSGFVSGSATDPTIKPGYYEGAKVCIDANDNGKCDSDENAVTTDASGKFSLPVSTADATSASVIADISTDATNTATGDKVPTRTVFRISTAQLTEQAAGGVVISPLSTEVMRMMEADSADYATEKQNLATRIGVTTDQVLSDINSVSGDAQKAMLTESNALTNRFAYAITKLDRGDLYPDALAVPGGDPELKGLSGVSQATVPTTPDSRKPITFEEAEQAAFNVEAIPRYDAVFVIVLENKATDKILNSPYVPKINAYLQANNQLTSYYATANPSEPNYTAMNGADDYGITDDSQWNCGSTIANGGSTDANAPQDLPLPTSDQPGLASSPFTATCTSATNHNLIGKPNLMTALDSVGLTWRTYNESTNPGQDIRTDSVADPAVTAADHVYQPGTTGGNATAVGDPSLVLPLPAALYKTKHNPGMAFQNVRSAPDFFYDNRTMGGGQWDATLKNSTKYTIPANYDYDQLGTDLQSGNVGNLNFVIPDQCDDMHGITVNGTNSSGATETASDCGGNTQLTRGDNYVDYLVKKIEASPLWKNQQKRVAIVINFDEGTATGVLNSCCGWDASKTTSDTPLVENADGTFSPDTSIQNYGNGNHGHGESIFGIITNQPDAPKGIQDSDAYSHFSLNRTFQDMFELADPEKPGSYMGRSRYTEKFIAENILNLPEYAGSADTHFDAVRPINHAYVIPANYVEKQSSDVNTPAQIGPDASQANVWAINK